MLNSKSLSTVRQYLNNSLCFSSMKGLYKPFVTATLKKHSPNLALHSWNICWYIQKKKNHFWAWSIFHEPLILTLVWKRLNKNVGFWMNACVILVAVAAFGCLRCELHMLRTSFWLHAFLKQRKLETGQTVTHSQCEMLLIFYTAPFGHGM